MVVKGGNWVMVNDIVTRATERNDLKMEINEVCSILHVLLLYHTDIPSNDVMW